MVVCIFSHLYVIFLCIYVREIFFFFYSFKCYYNALCIYLYSILYPSIYFPYLYVWKNLHIWKIYVHEIGEMKKYLYFKRLSIFAIDILFVVGMEMAFDNWLNYIYVCGLYIETFNDENYMIYKYLYVYILMEEGPGYYILYSPIFFISFSKKKKK